MAVIIKVLKGRVKQVALGTYQPICGIDRGISDHTLAGGSWEHPEKNGGLSMFRGLERWRSRGRGRDQGGVYGYMSGPITAGPYGKCVCQSCGHEVSHKVGQPCYEKKCPKCGEKMTRA